MGSFDEEWARLQAESRAELSRTRLNADEGGGAGSLTVASGAQRSAADYLETEVIPDVLRAGTRPVDELSEAAAHMPGWASAAGLQKVRASWLRKVSALAVQLAAETQALRGAADGFEGQELEITAQVRAAGSPEVR